LEKKWGRVIFISSESAIQIPAEMVHYGMTKTAHLAVARGIAESFPASGVTANSVLVGPTDSKGVGAFLDDGIVGSCRRRGDPVDRLSIRGCGGSSIPHCELAPPRRHAAGQRTRSRHGGTRSALHQDAVRQSAERQAHSLRHHGANDDECSGHEEVGFAAQARRPR
jgi:NAD(P)-dependent dehydrogenase (short-subunit alcohol dehydrogenase family)